MRARNRERGCVAAGAFSWCSTCPGTPAVRRTPAAAARRACGGGCRLAAAGTATAPRRCSRPAGTVAGRGRSRRRGLMRTSRCAVSRRRSDGCASSSPCRRRSARGRTIARRGNMRLTGALMVRACGWRAFPTGQRTWRCATRHAAAGRQPGDLSLKRIHQQGRAAFRPLPARARRGAAARSVRRDQGVASANSRGGRCVAIHLDRGRRSIPRNSRDRFRDDRNTGGRSAGRRRSSTEASAG